MNFNGEEYLKLPLSSTVDSLPGLRFSSMTFEGSCCKCQAPLSDLRLRVIDRMVNNHYEITPVGVCNSCKLIVTCFVTRVYDDRIVYQTENGWVESRFKNIRWWHKIWPKIKKCLHV